MRLTDVQPLYAGQFAMQMLKYCSARNTTKISGNRNRDLRLGKYPPPINSEDDAVVLRRGSQRFAMCVERSRVPARQVGAFVRNMPRFAHT